MKESLLLEKIYVFIVWILERIAKFPKEHKYSLGGRFGAKCFDLLENCIVAYGERDKACLLQVSRNLDFVRYYVRISKDLKLFSISQYEYACDKMNEMGKMVGSWIKADKTRN